jgi:hypothetical protein
MSTSAVLSQRFRIINVFTIILLMSFMSGCDEGLRPRSGTSSATGTIGGLITFVNWHAADSVYDMRVVAFTVFPPTDIISDVLQGRAVVHPPIGASALVQGQVDSVRYVMPVRPGTYPYLAVAQQYGPDLMADWRPIGQYDLDTTSAGPTPVTVGAAENVTGIDIVVDFANPPPLP